MWWPPPAPTLRQLEVQAHLHHSVSLPSLETWLTSAQWDAKGSLAGRFLERASCPWRRPWEDTRLCSSELCYGWPCLPEGAAWAKDPPESGPERAGRSLQASVRVGAVICTLLRCQDVHTWRRTCVSAKLASTLHMGGFPAGFFPVFSGGAALSSRHKKFIASPPLKSPQPSLLGFKVTALQINT